MDNDIINDLNLDKLNIKDLALLLEIVNEINPNNSNSNEEIEVI